MAAPVVLCPHCGRPVAWDSANRFRPFCSERCRLIDLGAWANESYRIPLQKKEDGTDDAEDAGEIPEPPAGQ